MKKINVAIDGFSGTGKSSTAKEIAKEFGYEYIDTGAMYRATTLYFIQQNIDLSDQVSINNALNSIDLKFKNQQIHLNDVDVSTEIRSMEVNNHVSSVAALNEVRDKMVEQQKMMGQSRGVVMDGRDIGTVVFPDAELKVFMTANSSVRAKRRLIELQEKGIEASIEDIESNLIERDHKDTTRATSPLTKATGAVELDTSNLTFDEQVSKIVALVKEKIHGN